MLLRVLVMLVVTTPQLVSQRADSFEAALQAYAGGDKAGAEKLLTAAARSGHAQAQFTLGFFLAEGRLGRQSHSEALKWYTLAAEAGHAEAQFALGYLYSTGQGVAVDDSAAYGWYLKSAEQGHAAAQSAVASMLAAGRGVQANPQEAVAWYARSAQQGRAEAQLALAVATREGVGVAQDLPAAAKWFRAAAERGLLEAQFNLGHLLLEAEPPLRNVTEADVWLRKAAGRGHVPAQRTLGAALLETAGGQAQDLEAVQWLQRAAEAGDAEAQHWMGYACANRRGLSCDEITTLGWYAKAARQGHAGALFLMRMMFVGEGDPASGEQALAMYRLGAEAGIAEAQHQLAHCYASGKFVGQNHEEAVRWWQRAADQQHAPAQLSLAQAFAAGQGVKQDAAEAVRWYLAAAEGGLHEAQFSLGYAYANALGVPQNDAEAVRWYRESAMQDHAEAQSNLGFMYFHGRGVERDLVEALRWTLLAAEHGDAVAASNREAMEKLLTPAQVRVAKSLAEGWRSPAKPSATPAPRQAGSQTRLAARLEGGFAVSSAGHVLASQRAVRGCARVSVVGSKGRRDAVIVAEDPTTGLNLLKAPDATDAHLPLSRALEPRLGDPVFAACLRPALQGPPTLEILSGRIRGTVGLQGNPDSFQITVPLEPHCHGAPLLDASGQVIGLALAAKTTIGGSHTDFGLKSSVFRLFLDKWNVPYETGAAVPTLTPAPLAAQAGKASVLIECRQ